METMTRDCLPPDPAPRPPHFAMPPGACDCHAHVIGAPPDYPLVAERAYTPPPAPLAAFQALHRALGIARAVIVQPSAHGTDNRVTLEAIAGYGPNARGVAVVEATVSDRDLAALQEGGIRGLRLNNLFGGGVGFEALEPLAARAAELGWHIQIWHDGATMQDLAPRLRRLTVPVVIDHLGHMNTALGLAHPGFQALLELVRDGICWVKLSGNYRISAAGPPYHDAIPFARALIEAAPAQMVWGSDWPHVALYDAQLMPNDGDLLDALDDYAPDAALKQAILVDNPARLYGFAD